MLENIKRSVRNCLNYSDFFDKKEDELSFYKNRDKRGEYLGSEQVIYN